MNTANDNDTKFLSFFSRCRVILQVLKVLPTVSYNISCFFTQ